MLSLRLLRTNAIKPNRSSSSINPLLKPYTQTSFLSTSSSSNPVKSAVTALLHGSEEAREESRQQHSKLVGRGKYVHEFQKHKVQPQHVEAYKALIAPYYSKINESKEFDCRLTGSWEVVVGEVDTFVHIWEYEGLPGFESTKKMVKESKGHMHTFNKEILPLLTSRSSQLTQEFNFWRVAPPAVTGGIFELRTYALKPGALLEWEHEWRVGLEARLKSGHSPIGAWFSQIGRLHEVHHIWKYDSLEQRRLKRQEAWEIDTWSETVSKTVKLATHMDVNILRALDYSPIR